MIDPSALMCIDEEWNVEFGGKDFNGFEDIGSSPSPEDLQSCRAPADNNILDVVRSIFWNCVFKSIWLLSVNQYNAIWVMKNVFYE